MLLRFSFFSTARFHSIINILIVFLQIFSLLLLGQLPFHFPPNHMLYRSSYPAKWERVSRLIRDKAISRTKSYNYRHSEPSSSSFNLCVRARSWNSQYQQSKYLQGRDEISLIKTKWEVWLHFTFIVKFYCEDSSISFIAKTAPLFSRKISENMKRFQIIVSRILSCVLLPGFRRWSIKNERHKATFRHKVSEELQKAISCFFDFISSFSLFSLDGARLENFNHHCADSISLSLTLSPVRLPSNVGQKAWRI